MRKAEDGWNTRDPQKVALAYSIDSRWRNRNEFLTGRDEIIAFLTRKWQRELDYRLIKELWAFTRQSYRRALLRTSRTIDRGKWFRSYGNENWEFDANGLMTRAPRQHQRPRHHRSRRGSSTGRRAAVRTTHLRGLQPQIRRSL